MIGYENALRIVQTRAGLIGDERVSLAQAARRVLSRDVMSTTVVPRFGSSAMDGFAVNGVHTRYRVLARITAGESSALTLGDGEAIEIMTGAPLPAGAEAIVRVEDVTRSGDTIAVTQPPSPRAFFRPAGEDYERGDRVVAAGQVLTPHALMAATAVGEHSVWVRKQPRIAVVATGNELVEPGEPLSHPASIWNSSAVYLQTAFWPADVTVYPTVRDDPAALNLDGIDADIIITTGAVSMGHHDFIPALLGERVVFHKVAIKPGKPILFADLGARVFFGLPGNPVSTAVGARFFVWPYLARLLGLPDERGTPSTLVREAKRPDGLTCFFKARRHGGQVEVLPGQGSHLIRPLLEADCWAALANDVQVYSLERER